MNQYVGQLRKLYERYLKLKDENDTVENALQFQNEIITSNLGNVSKEQLENLTVHYIFFDSLCYGNILQSMLRLCDFNLDTRSDSHHGK